MHGCMIILMDAQVTDVIQQMEQNIQVVIFMVIGHQRQEERFVITIPKSRLS